MRVYFDTSLIVTLTVMEDGWTPLARWLIEQMPKPFYSDFGWGEFVSSIGLKVRRREIEPEDARTIIDEVGEYLRTWTRLKVRRRDLLEGASMIEDFSLGLRFPDAIHIATARRTGCTLVSGDRKQIIAARRLGLTVVNPLEGGNNT